MYNKWDAPLSNTDFISIMVLSYTRPDYIIPLLQSLHEHADLPFEIILHDDASGRELENRIYKECRNLCSTMIFGSPEGINMGFAASANRGVALCNSEYILFLNDDVKCLRPCFRTIRQVLQVPYVGCFGPWGVRNDGQATKAMLPVRSNNLNFHLTALPNGAGLFAFRKSVWQEVGGFTQVYTNAGDTGFMVKTLKAGYFSASNLVMDAEMFTNVDQVAGYQDPTAGKTRFDSSYPHIFRTDIVNNTSFPDLCVARKQRIYNYSHENYYKPAGDCNHIWWFEQFEKARENNPQAYNWEKFEYPQAQWKEQVELDAEAWRQFRNG